MVYSDPAVRLWEAIWEGVSCLKKKILSIDVAVVRKTAPPGELDKTSDEEIKTIPELSAAMTPKDRKITEGSVAVMRSFEPGKRDASLISRAGECCSLFQCAFRLFVFLLF